MLLPAPFYQFKVAGGIHAAAVFFGPSPEGFAFTGGALGSRLPIDFRYCARAASEEIERCSERVVRISSRMASAGVG